MKTSKTPHNTSSTKTSKVKTDLADSKDDQQHLLPDEGTLDLPDVKDIPGQEHIQVPKFSEMADTTISSDDEEGKGILDDEDDDGELDSSTNVSREEKQALMDAAEKMPGEDTDDLERAKLQQRDDEGELLNEKSGLSGGDLDIPGSEDDDDLEEIGEEDEENNSYSLDGETEDDSISKE